MQCERVIIKVLDRSIAEAVARQTGDAVELFIRKLPDGHWAVCSNEEDYERAKALIEEVLGRGDFMNGLGKKLYERTVSEWESNGASLSKRDSGKNTVNGSFAAAHPLVALFFAKCRLTAAICVCLIAVYLWQAFDFRGAFDCLSAEGFRLSDPMTWYRIMTPACMHGSLFHIGINMCWLIWLGMRMELSLSKPAYAAILLLGAAVPNYVQLSFFGPSFVGASGVVMALMGFCWVASMIKPEEYGRLALPPGFMALALLFVVLGFMDILPGAGSANGCHAAGIAIGCALGAYHAYCIGKSVGGIRG